MLYRLSRYIINKKLKKSPHLTIPFLVELEKFVYGGKFTKEEIVNTRRAWSNSQIDNAVKSDE